jgi:hypothetical protein
MLRIVADQDGARLVLYAGQPQGDPMVSHGPFVGDSKEDIMRLFNEYRAGLFERMSEIARAGPVGQRRDSRLDEARRPE